MESFSLQRSVKTAVQCSGIGVHSGKQVNLTVKPAPINHGIKFVRIDLPNKPSISACFNKVVDTSQATVIGSEGFIVSTIEHLMAAFAGLAIDNALVEVNAYELPIMDGSAGPFTRMLKSAGIEYQNAPRCFFMVHKPIELAVENKFVGIYPSPYFKLTCTIEYNHPLIETQTYSMTLTPKAFEREIADARTFGFLHEANYMRQYGLAKGASLDTAVVIDDQGVMNEEGLRFDDEFVRHKFLDCIGDFALLGLPIIGHIVTKRSGHGFNHAFVEHFFSNKNAWQTCTLDQDTAWNAKLKQLAN